MSIKDYKYFSSLKKWGLIFFCIINVALGTLGAFLPILPTTPFILLAAYCFIRSSDKLYNWLINHKKLGRFVREYSLENGLTIKTKVVSLVCGFTSMITTSFFLEKLSLKLLLYFLCLVQLVTMLKIKTKE
jgi:uncharacterized membrane protein YbaN (DUF454 family)